jgi:hypothetical protein
MGSSPPQLTSIEPPNLEELPNRLREPTLPPISLSRASTPLGPTHFVFSTNPLASQTPFLTKQVSAAQQSRKRGPSSLFSNFIDNSHIDKNPRTSINFKNDLD